MNLQVKRDVFRKFEVFDHAVASSDIALTCMHFGISKDIFYQWKRRMRLINSKSCMLQEP